jgi:hypothetical protein
VLVVNSDRTAYEFATRLQASDLAGYVQQVNGLDPDGSGNVEITTEDINEAAPNLYYTDARFDTRYATKTHYHNRYSTEAESERSGATATLEIYYTARPDGDGYAESEVSDVGETDTINRTLYYSTKFQADPDTAGDWTEYTTQPADNATFATAKAALLAGLNETDATAETRGTLPLSLKMVRTTTAAAADLLLDTYSGAAAAYSVRKLRNAHSGACMRIRRASDDAETDIGFDSNGDLDTAAIASHCGASAGYCVTWVDQSGNGNNATQSTAGSQPQIYNGTAVVTENGKPALDLDGNDNLRVLFASAYSQPNNYFVTATLDTTASATVLLSGHTSSSKRNQPELTSGNLWQMYAGSALTSSTSGDTDQHLHNCLFNGASSEYYLDGSSIASGNSGTFPMDGITIGARFTQTLGWDGTIQEVIMWPSDQSSNRTGIETDIDTYFSIT